MGRTALEKALAAEYIADRSPKGTGESALVPTELVAGIPDKKVSGICASPVVWTRDEVAM